jgi:hypothetical protein
VQRGVPLEQQSASSATADPTRMAAVARIAIDRVCIDCIAFDLFIDFLVGDA